MFVSKHFQVNMLEFSLIFIACTYKNIIRVAGASLIFIEMSYRNNLDSGSRSLICIDLRYLLWKNDFQFVGFLAHTEIYLR